MKFVGHYHFKIMQVEFKKLNPLADIPSKANEGDAGFDLTGIEYSVKTDESTGVAFIEYSTGIAVKIPNGYVGILAPRSSISSRTDLFLANSVGVIDSGYRGEIKFRFKTNLSKPHTPAFTVAQIYDLHERIGQLLIMPLANLPASEVSEFSPDESNTRGTGGFGSTGRH
jgi:dUTP pyrophosphatase